MTTQTFGEHNQPHPTRDEYCELFFRIIFSYFFDVEPSATSDVLAVVGRVLHDRHLQGKKRTQMNITKDPDGNSQRVASGGRIDI